MAAAGPRKPTAVKQIPYESFTDWKSVGVGIFGEVFKARDTKRGQKFALRLIHFKCDELNAYTEASSMLITEATDMSRAQHKHILEVCGFCIVPNKGFALVLPYMSRGSLEELLLREPDTISDWPSRIRILLQIAEGMRHLHSLNPQLLHLDLKPANVWLTDNLDVKVADFGLWRARRLMTAPRSDTSLRGTVEYTPPEHLKPTTKFDVYSYGITVWQVITGKRPYDTAIDEIQIAASVVKGERPDLSTVDTKGRIQETVVECMERCWAQDAASRPEFSEVIDMLKLAEVSQCIYDAYKFNRISCSIDSHTGNLLFHLREGLKIEATKRAMI